MKIIRVGLAAACLVGSAMPAIAQQLAPPAYQDLEFNPDTGLYAFRLNGAPWTCPASSFCKPVRLDGIADKDLPGADIQSLGHAERRYFLSFRHPGYDKGRASIFNCLDDRCARLDSDTGQAVLLDVFPVKQGSDIASRSAILRNLDAANNRSQLLWCGENGCAELPVTRDAELHLNFMGRARQDGVDKIFLRDQSGAVLQCGQPEAGVDDRMNCDRTSLAFEDFPRPAAGATVPAPAPAPNPAASAEADQRALSGSIDSAIRNGDFITADRLLADATRRYPKATTWSPYQQQLAKARAARELQQRTDEARRLIEDARRYAAYDDFDGAEFLLQQANQVYPNFPEIGQARADIGRMRAERDRDLREQYQYSAAIERAFAAWNLWEAERLIGSARQRYPQDPTFRTYADQLSRIKAQAQWQERLHLSRGYIGAARTAMNKGDFGYAERQLALAQQTTPGLPEISQAQVDLARLRARAQVQNEDVRRLTSAIDDAILRKQFDDAEKMLQDGRRRYPSYEGWNEIQRDLAQARAGNDRQTRDQQERRKKAFELIASARQAGDKGDFAAAGKMLDDAAKLQPNLPEIATAHADIERQRADRERQDKETGVIAAAIDAAIKRNQYPAAEQLLRDGQRKYPSYKGWDDLQKRIADGRKAWQPGPDGKPAGASDNKGGTPDKAEAQRVAALVTQGRAALGKNDLAAAEKALLDAEKIDAKEPTVAKLRADFEAEKKRAEAQRIGVLVTQGRAALGKNDLAAAEKALLDAEKIDAKEPTVAKLRADFDAARKKAEDQRAAEQKLRDLLAAVRRDTAAGKFAEAETSLKQAEALSPNAPDVKAMRGEFERSKRQAGTKPASPAPGPTPATAPTPAPSPAPAGGVKPGPAPAPASAPSPAPATGVDKATADKVAALVAQAREAIKKHDFRAADTALDQAEKLDAKAPEVIKARAELDAAEPGRRRNRQQQ